MDLRTAEERISEMEGSIYDKGEGSKGIKNIKGKVRKYNEKI